MRVISSFGIVTSIASAYARTIVPGNAIWCPEPNFGGDCLSYPLEWDTCFLPPDSNRMGVPTASFKIIDVDLPGDTKCTFFYANDCPLDQVKKDLSGKSPLWYMEIGKLSDAMFPRGQKKPFRSFWCNKCDQDVKD